MWTQLLEKWLLQRTLGKAFWYPRYFVLRFRVIIIFFNQYLATFTELFWIINFSLSPLYSIHLSWIYRNRIWKKTHQNIVFLKFSFEIEVRGIVLQQIIFKFTIRSEGWIQSYFRLIIDKGSLLKLLNRYW